MGSATNNVTKCEACGMLKKGGDGFDGYHTFGELYEHRLWLWITVCKLFASQGRNVWRSRWHSDGTGFDGWFVLGYGAQEGSQVTYHLPDRLWDDCGFADERERAPEFDGHTSADVLTRLRRL